MEPDNAALLAFFKAMANESRLRLVGLLAERERSVQELAELLELKEPTVSHHLAVLKGLGVVTARIDGVTHWHRLKPDAFSEFSKAMFAPERVAALAKPAQSWEDKVLGVFLQPDGLFSKLPASRRKRQVLLKWLVEQLDEDRRYPESEINQFLQTRHWDSATMRREMVDYRMLAREKGVYWRLPKEGWLEVG